MARLRHRRNIQSAAAGLLGESIWPGTAWANLAAFRWRLSMDHYTKGKVVCRSRLGGMLNFYHREAA